MNITAQDLVKIASYLTPISHTIGRIRVRVSPKIKELAKDIQLSDLDSVILNLNGIKNVKFNKIIGSITIEYDNAIFPKELWEDLLNGRNLETLSQKINYIAKDFYAK